MSTVTETGSDVALAMDRGVIQRFRDEKRNTALAGYLG